MPNYTRVTYKELYPDIDAVFYGNGHEMEHDFLVSAGADHRRIRMHLSPNAHAALAADGSLTLSVAGVALSMRNPVIYQDAPEGRHQRAGSFRMLPDGDVGFSIKSYDPRRALVIDLVLSFSTYLSKDASVAGQIAIDASGNNHVAGIATLDFPVTPTAFPGCAHCTANTVVTFVSKLSPEGANLLYSTVLGGSGFAQPTGLAVDGAGNAVVSGWTKVADFPTRFAQPIAAQLWQSLARGQIVGRPVPAGDSTAIRAAAAFRAYNSRLDVDAVRSLGAPSLSFQPLWAVRQPAMPAVSPSTPITARMLPGLPVMAFTPRRECTTGRCPLLRRRSYPD